MTRLRHGRHSPKRQKTTNGAQSAFYSVHTGCSSRRACVCGTDNDGLRLADWNIFLEKLLVPQLDKANTAFYGPKDPSTCIRAFHFCVHSQINPVYTNHFFFNIHFHIFSLMPRFYRLLFLSSFPMRTLRACLLSPVRATLPSLLIL
jgi:hypothetical protein